MAYLISIFLSVAFLILQGLAVWYGVNYADDIARHRQAAAEKVATAPRIFVAAEHTFHGYLYLAEDHRIRLEDTPLFGKSLWWGDDWQSYINFLAENRDICISGEETTVSSADELQRFTTRPKPENGTAQRITVRSLIPVALFWSEGTDGLYRVSRIEARNSAEDTPREGEMRTLGELRSDTKYITLLKAEKKAGQLIPTAYIALDIESAERRNAHPRVTYNLSYRERKILQNWNRRFAPPDYTMELALPPGKPPVPLRAFINGHPFDEGLKYMIDGKFPPKIPLKKHTESVQS